MFGIDMLYFKMSFNIIFKIQGGLRLEFKKQNIKLRIKLFVYVWV